MRKWEQSWRRSPLWCILQFDLAPSQKYRQRSSALLQIQHTCQVCHPSGLMDGTPCLSHSVCCICNMYCLCCLADPAQHPGTCFRLNGDMAVNDAACHRAVITANPVWHMVCQSTATRDVSKQSARIVRCQQQLLPGRAVGAAVPTSRTHGRTLSCGCRVLVGCC